jgi:hypothetical protein
VSIVDAARWGSVPVCLGPRGHAWGGIDKIVLVIITKIIDSRLSKLGGSWGIPLSVRTLLTPVIP